MELGNCRAAAISGQQSLIDDPDGFAAFAALFGTSLQEWEFYTQSGPLVPGRREILPVINVGGDAVSWDVDARAVAVDWEASDPSAYINDNSSFHTDLVGTARQPHPTPKIHSEYMWRL